MASDIHFLAISCLYCHNAPAAFKCCGQGKREWKRVCSSNFIPVPFESPLFFFNLEIYCRAACNLFFFFLAKLFIHKKQIHVAWDILQIHVELFWIFKKLVKNSLYILNRMCLYLKEQFCEAGKTSVTPAIFFCVEPMCSPTDGFIKGCSRKAASPSWLNDSHFGVM